MPESVKKCVGHFFQVLHISNLSCRDYARIREKMRGSFFSGATYFKSIVSGLRHNHKKRDTPWKNKERFIYKYSLQKHKKTGGF